MHPDQDFAPGADLPANADDLLRDLGLEAVLSAMARGDAFLLEISRSALLSSLTDPARILYRQRILADCLAAPDVVREIYTLAVQAIEGERKFYLWSLRSPDSILHRSSGALAFLAQQLQRLRRIAQAHVERMHSEGMRRLFGMLQQELDDPFFRAVEAQLEELRSLDGGMLVSAELGAGQKGAHYVLRSPLPERRGWLQRVLPRSSAESFSIAERDEAGLQALAQLRGRGLNPVANALAQSVDHVLHFFRLLREELGFYVGALNLHEELSARGEPVCMPVPAPAQSMRLSARGLYDVSLALGLDTGVVGSDLAADGRPLVLITGANQGGKSTFLRGIGLCQLMLQAGMFVGALEYAASCCLGLFTHYPREEDERMQRGRLDEELHRLDGIVERMRPHAMLLCNESLASTNEREGSEIAGQVVQALVESKVRVLFVTHLVEFAQGAARELSGQVLCLRADRQEDGRRTFRIVEGDPLPTGFGEDLYRQIFETRVPGADAR